MDRELVVASRNADKVREIEALLRPFRVRVLGLDTLLDPSPEEDDVEAFDTFAANARAKARFFARRLGRPVAADDSGIVVPALDGAPGVQSKFFAEQCGWTAAPEPDPASRTFAETERDRFNNRLLLERLAGTEGETRRAYYACVAAYAEPDGAREVMTAGTCSGLVADRERGTGGFGYDPLFLVPSLGATFGEADAAAKERLSHRARAFRALASALFL